MSKIQQFFRDRKAENMMNYEQIAASELREEYLKKSKEKKLNGFISEAYYERIKVGLGRIHFRAEVNGHAVEGDFYFKVNAIFREDDDFDRTWSQEVDESSITVFSVDGKEVSKAAAVEFISEHIDLIQIRAREREHEEMNPRLVIHKIEVERNRRNREAENEVIEKEIQAKAVEEEKHRAEIKAREEAILAQKKEKAKKELDELLK